MRTRVLARMVLFGTVFFVGSVTSAYANPIEIDLSSIVNAPFSHLLNNGTFTGFAPIIGNTMGNQGTGIPFLVANTSFGNNYWLGFGQTVTVPVGLAATTVYTLTDNINGTEGADEYNITFTPTSGSPITGQYIGGNNTKDFNFVNCNSTGCDVTPNAQNWFIDSGGGQGLQVVAWTLPPDFGTLASVTVTQVAGSTDAAIFAGLTVETAQTPEPSGLALFGTLLGGLGHVVRRQLSRRT